jgi:hypothetical protein
MATYWHFLTQIGWNYVDGVGISYYLFALALITGAADSARPRIWLVFTGAAIAAQLSTNLFLITLLPLHIVYWLVICGCARGIKTGLGDGVAVLAGFCCLLAAFSLYFFAVTDSWSFFYSQIMMAVSILNHSGSTVGLMGYDVPPTAEWTRSAHWLKLPTVVFVASIFYFGLAVRWSHLRHRASMLLLGMFVAQYMIMVCLQPNGRVLIISWYASYLIPTMFLAIGGMLAPLLGTASGQRIGIYMLGVVATVSSLFCLPQQSVIAKCCAEVAMASGLINPLLFLFGCALVLVFAAGERRPVAAWTAVVILGCSMSIFNYGMAAQECWAVKYRRNAFQAINDGAAVIDAVRGDVRSVRFWYDMQSGEHAPTVYSSLNSVYLWGYAIQSTQFPSLVNDPKICPDLPPGTLLVVLSPNGGVVRAALDALSHAGVSGELVQEARIRRGKVAYVITLLQVLPADQSRELAFQNE